jgi:hypothetical protein
MNKAVERLFKRSKVVSARTLAKIIHRSKLRWGVGQLANSDGGYCALGILAMEAGVDRETLHHSPQGPAGLMGIFETNDRLTSKEDVVQALCAMGDRKFPVGHWVDELKRGE